MKDSQPVTDPVVHADKYIKANNDRFSTQTKNIDVEG